MAAEDGILLEITILDCVQNRWVTNCVAREKDNVVR
jgi:hypothetical protein